MYTHKKTWTRNDAKKQTKNIQNTNYNTEDTHKNQKHNPKQNSDALFTWDIDNGTNDEKYWSCSYGVREYSKQHFAAARREKCNEKMNLKPNE